MKQRMMMVALTVGLIVVTGAWATEEGGRPYLGVRLDQEGVPDLLRGHLGLKEGVGLVVQNVQKGSPADTAGLERGDVIVAFEGKEVTNYPDFVAAIHEAGAGNKVTVGVIHAGKQRDVDVTLGSYEGETEPEWKYPEREEPMGGRGRVWRMEPGERNWQAVPYEQMPEPLHRFFQQKRVFRLNEDGREMEITIEGSPQSDEADVTVKDIESGETHTAKARELESLPKQYREAAQEALERAQQQGGGTEFHWGPFGQEGWPDMWREFRQEQWPQLQQQGREEIEELRREVQQMKKDLQEQIDKRQEELEKQTKELRQQLRKMMRDLQEQREKLQQRDQEKEPAKGEDPTSL